MERILHRVLLWGAGLVILCRPLISGLVYPASNTGFMVALIFLWFVWGLRCVAAGVISLRLDLQDLLHFALLAAVGFSWAYSSNPNDAIPFVLNITAAMMTYALLRQIVSGEGAVRKYFGLLVCGAGLVSLFGIYQALFGLDETRAWVQSNIPLEGMPESFKARLSSERIFSTFVYPNALAGYLLAMLPPVLGFLWTAGRRLQAGIILFLATAGAFVFVLFEKESWVWVPVLLSGVYPALLTAALVLTHSKAGLLVFFILRLAMYVFFRRFIAQRLRRPLFWVIMIMESAMLFGVILNLDTIMVKAWVSLKVRLEYWQAALGMIRDFPVTGTGPGTFGSVFSRYRLPMAEETRMAHNNFLQVWSESGPMAGLAFLGIWMSPIVIFLAGFRRRDAISHAGLEPLRAGLALGLAGIVLHGLVDFDLYEPGLAMQAWVLLALFHLSSRTRSAAFGIRVHSNLSKAVWIVGMQAFAIAAILVLRGPFLAEDHLQKALKARHHGDWSAMGRHLEHVIRLNPLNPHAYFFRGILREQQGDLEGSLKDFDYASRLDVFNPAYSYRAAVVSRALARQGRKDFSGMIEGFLERAVDDYPSNPHYRLKLAQYLESVGRTTEALLQYVKIRELGLDTPQIRDKMRKLRKNYEENPRHSRP